MFVRQIIGIGIRLLAIAIVVFNAFVPTTALARPLSADYQMGNENKNFTDVLYQIATCQTSGDLVIANGETCNLPSGTYTYNSIIVQTGGTLIVSGNTSLNQGVTINVPNMTVESGGKVNADGKG